MAARTFLVPNPCGAIAQLGERIVRNDEVVGSIPTSSTNLNDLRTRFWDLCSIVFQLNRVPVQKVFQFTGQLPPI